MQPVPYKVTRKTIFLPIAGIIAFLIYLYLFNVDIPTIIATVQRIELSAFAVATIFVLLETFFYTLSWRFLLHFLGVKLSIIRAYLYVWYGIFIDIIIPAESISGEIMRLYQVEREQTGTGGKVVASLVVQRIMGMSINIASLLAGLLLLLAEGQVSGIVLILIAFLVAATAIFLILLVLLCFRESWTLRIVDAVIRLVEFVSRGRWKLGKMRENAVASARVFHGSIKEYGRAPLTLSVSFVSYAVTWLCNLGIAYLVFVSLKYPISWSTIIVTSSILIAVKSVPMGIPFEFGLPEVTMTTMYFLLGVNKDISAAATILTQVLTVWLRLLIGFVAQQWIEFKALRKPETIDIAAIRSETENA